MTRARRTARKVERTTERKVDRRVERRFRYGARLAVTAPFALVFSLLAAEMMVLGQATSSTAWRVVFITVGSISTLVALGMVREVVARIRGKRQIVVGASELAMPDGTAIAVRDITALELRGERDFRRVLEIRHANGKLEISNLMLGTVAELDEIHGLIKAARKPR